MGGDCVTKTAVAAEDCGSCASLVTLEDTFAAYGQAEVAVCKALKDAVGAW